jgi:hypothetical protein
MMAQENPMPPEGRVIATERYESAALHTTLTLYHRALAEPSKAAQLRYILNTKPAAGAGNNLMFYLVTGEPGQPNRKVVWLTYGASSEKVQPQAIYSASVHPMPSLGSAYVAVAKAQGAAVDFHAYRVDLTKSIASFPLVLDTELREGWPAPSSPEASMTYKPAERTFCVVASLELSTDQQRLAIRAVRQPISMCGPLRVTFQPDSRRWSDVAVLPVEPVQK